MFARSKLYSLLVALLALAIRPSDVRAQDYPYDDEPPSSDVPNDASVESPHPALGTRLPVESVQTRGRGATRVRQPSLFRLAVKSGGNFAVLNSASDGDFSGFGLEGALSLGWDLAYQPIFFELETGYRNHFVGDDTLHIVPLRFGTHYRKRIGRTSLWRPGVAVSLDARIEKATLGSDFSLVPALHFASSFEFSGFLVEPQVSLYRLGGAITSLAAALRIGYRFL